MAEELYSFAEDDFRELEWLRELVIAVKARDDRGMWFACHKIQKGIEKKGYIVNPEKPHRILRAVN